MCVFLTILFHFQVRKSTSYNYFELLVATTLLGGHISKTTVMTIHYWVYTQNRV